MSLPAKFSLRIGVIALSLFAITGAFAGTAVTTYHNDNNRTGWNNTETSLTPANVNATSFGLLRTITVDDQVDTQVLVVPGVNITAGSLPGIHDVAYIATEGNTIYAVDTNTGAILLSPKFGTPVPLPLGCSNNGPNVGINGTPVIDAATNTMYVLVYTNDGPTYRIHALDLASLTDKVTPVVVSASHQLTDGTTYSFNAKYQRQRPGLLLANGNIYAGFGSFCDFSADKSRGWLLGWQTGNLTPIGANQLLDTQATSPNSFFLSAIWMSGYGPASDENGNIFFITGNSDYSGTTYDGINNIQESVVKVSSDVTRVVDLFTPKNQASLEQGDTDFGSGGLLVIPAQPGSTPNMAVALGKAGSMFLLNRDNLGGYNPNGTNKVLGTYTPGGCWCGQSYFQASDGTGRILSSGGRKPQLWKINTSPKASLTRLSTAPVGVAGGQDVGFFTSISSNGTANPVVWAVSRPANKDTTKAINLFAFDPNNGLTKLYSSPAGFWPNNGGNSNIVPTVANGQVYVPSNKQVQVFSLTSPSKNVVKSKK